MPCSSFVVAIIDDDDFIRDALAALLPALDCKVELYASADAFLAGFERSRASCLLIDIHLGVVSGISLGRALVQAGFKFPVIYMTGSTDDLLRHQAHDAGGVAFLRKPFTPADLSGALDVARRREPTC